MRERERGGGETEKDRSFIIITILNYCDCIYSFDYGSWGDQF